MRACGRQAARAARARPRKAPAGPTTCADHGLEHARHRRCVPPKRSASVTTPTGSDVQAAMQFCASRRSAAIRRHLLPAPRRSSQISSEEPPPISNTSAKSQLQSISEAQPETASLASVSRLTILMSSPVSARTRARNSGALHGQPAGLGGDQARAVHLVPAHLAPRTPSAPRCVRSIAASDSRPLVDTPSPEADDARERVDHLEAAPRGARHQQAAVVGAEIERRIEHAGWAGTVMGLGPRAGHGSQECDAGIGCGTSATRHGECPSALHTIDFGRQCGAPTRSLSEPSTIIPQRLVGHEDPRRPYA